jgi:hypothetical protein
MAFDVNAYLAANPDVAAVANASNWTDEQVIEHYTTFGFAEGRVLFWNTALYLSLNPDVAAALGTAVNLNQAAMAHYTLFGADEGRAYFFDAADYLAANPDLVAAGITTEVGALSHYQMYGSAEGRLLGFDAEAYLEMYPDLAAGGITEETALEHYTAFGQAEGRAYDPIVEEDMSSPIAATQTDDDATTNNTYLLSLNSMNKTQELTADDLVVDGGAGTDVLRLIGDSAVRIDLTNPASQVEGTDLDSGGLIETNGIENNLTGNDILTVSNFEVVDAYRRDQYDTTVTSNADNFRGSILFDGTGFDGDGENTDGNIFLGGISDDVAYGGIGNDFLAGGGFFVDTDDEGWGYDYLFGGRNADFFFVEISALDPVDGDSLIIDGGTTYDLSSAQDTDWILLEASDDNEPVVVTIGVDIDDTAGSLFDRVEIENTENLDASGNLYGFLNNFDVVLGGEMDYKAAHAADGTENYGLGSTAQLEVIGTGGANIIVGGYDNDSIYGEGGNDVLLGGNMMYLTENQNNPNVLDIPNDGKDRLYGSAGNDELLFEMDGGTYDGGEGGTDTLWATDYVGGSSTVGALASDDVLRLDLGAGQSEDYAGYGGYDNPWGANNADKTNYAFGGPGNATVVEIENVIATGLGKLDYDTDGTNESDLNFTSQMNFDALGNVDMDLRGSTGGNILFADGGDDVLEGRNGHDYLSGGEGNDDFYFSLDGDEGMDGQDVILRQVDANADGFWDKASFFDPYGSLGGVVGQDFGLDSSTTYSASVLQISITSDDNPGAELGEIINRVSEIRTGVLVDGTFDPVVLNTDAIKAATTYQGLTDAINAALAETTYAADLSAELQSDGVTIYIQDAQGRELADDFTEAEAGVDISQKANTQTENLFVYGEPEALVSEDRLIFKAYEDRADNEGVDDDAITGSTISLGSDAYAQDLVASFGDSTVLAEDQIFNLVFGNLTTEDVVTVSVNSVEYSLQVGIDLDGSHIENEDTADGTSQADIQDNFLQRLVNHINSFMDDDTAAGKVNAAYISGTTIQLTQAGYGEGGEEVVFMNDPAISIQNLSGGQGATGRVTDLTQTEVTLFKFDGTDNALNEENVLFIGEEFVSRSVFATALDAGGALMGSDALVIDGIDDDLADIPLNMAIDNASTLDDNFAVHGDDLLFGGIGDDTISGLTGDDRIVGSAGVDTVDGGKDFYAVLRVGDDEYAVEYYNAYEAEEEDAEGDVLEIDLIRQTEAGELMIAAVPGTNPYEEYFDDTLLFQQDDFETGVTEFTIALDNFSGTGANIVFDEGGAGHVYVDEDADADFDHTTTFTNFENIRTVSGTGLAVADDGQGNDTLDLTELSDDSSGVTYFLTDGNNAGDVFVHTGDHYDFVDNDNDGDTNTMEGGNVNQGQDDSAAPYLDYVVPTTAADIYFGKVDGVESVLAFDGDDLLFIDETEAAKHNLFDGDEGADAIIYQNDYVLGLLGDVAQAATDAAALGGATEASVIAAINAIPATTAAQLLAADTGTNTAAASLAAILAHADTIAQNLAVSSTVEPTVTIEVNAATDTDVVTMTAGRVGLTEAEDTLVGVENINLEGYTAEGVREDDTIDVTNMTSGAVVDYAMQQIRDLSDNVELVIVGMARMETVLADGNDTVIVANADAMSGANLTSDYAGDVAGVPAAIPGDDADITIDTWLNYDMVDRRAFLKFGPARLSIGELRGIAAGTADTNDSGDIPEVINFGQYTFDLSFAGSGSDSDTVDYSNQVTGQITAVYQFNEDDETQYVMVDDDGLDYSGTNPADNDRIDILEDVENIVASQGESIIDLTNSDVDLKVRYNAEDGPSDNVDELDRDIFAIQVSNLETSVPFQAVNYLEYFDAGEYDVLADDGAVIVQPTAAWNRIEGSDNAEMIELTDHETTDDHTFNLRGGENEVNYNELTRSIRAEINLATWAFFNPLGTGRITVDVDFYDGEDNLPANIIGGDDLITSYTNENGIASGSLRIEASQDAEDTLAFNAATADKILILGEIVDGSDQITVTFTGSAQNTMELTGFEFLEDSISDDVYTVEDFSRVVNNLTLIDNDPTGTNDRDTIEVFDDTVGAGAMGANEIDLEIINDEIGFDFDVLDIRGVEDDDLIIIGDDDDDDDDTTLNWGAFPAGVTMDVDYAGNALYPRDLDDDIIVGDLDLIYDDLVTGGIVGFRTIFLTNASIDSAGNEFVLDYGDGQLQDDSAALFRFDQLAAGGGANQGTGIDASMVTGEDLALSGVASGGVGLLLFGGDGDDVISGDTGDDDIKGGGGADTLDGGQAAEIRVAELSGTLDDVVALQDVTLALGTAAVTLTVNEANAIVDTDATDGDLDVLEGSGADAVGTALATLVNANLAAINVAGNFTDGAADVALLGASYDNATDNLTFTFEAGADVTIGDIIGADTDTGTFAITATANTTVQGGAGGDDDYFYDRASDGGDTIAGFESGGDEIFFLDDQQGVIGASIDDNDNDAFGWDVVGGAFDASLVDGVQEGLFIDNVLATANGGFLAADLTDLTEVADMFDDVFNMSNEQVADFITVFNTSEALLVLESDSDLGTFGFYYWQASDDNDTFDAAEITLLGVVDGDTVATGDFDVYVAPF